MLPHFKSTKSPTVYAMIDCNNFYSSCERVFAPSLYNKPIVILSNNDGCVIARSQEAKKIGVPMGAPEFKYRKFFKENGVVVRSSNYALYGNMSHRVMETLRHLTPNIEVYSIDEAFAELSPNICSDLDEYGRIIKETVVKWTGLPVSVGIAPSKTLAKIANETAKRNEEYKGVLNLCGHQGIDYILEKTSLKKIWGIGHNLSLRLNRDEIRTAMDLKKTINNQKWVRKHLSVTGWRTVLELNGFACLKLHEALDSRKGIVTSRMFGKPLYSLQEIQEAVSTFVTRAAEKLRAQHSVASNLQIILTGDKYDNLKGKYKYCGGFPLKVATAHTPTLIKAAKAVTETLFLEKTKYKKAAVILTGLVPNSEIQMNLFDPELYTQRQYQLMECMDHINANYGRNTTAFAATGLHKEKGSYNKWTMNQHFLSQKYTTSWKEIMTVKAK
ncbi:MAG: Y-family DNA polymerase [Balneolaceae bacterium]